MRRTVTIIAGVLLFFLVLPVQGLITRPLELKLLLSSSAHICVVKVEKFDPERPAMVLNVEADLKGKGAPRRWPVNLTGDREATKYKHTPQLLKRLAKDLSILVFLDEKPDRFIGFAYSEGTWFSLVGEKDKETVRWSFTHCEPYLRRTFKGTTAELREVMEKAIKDKKELPPADPKVEPGFGPEIKEKAPEPKDKGASRGRIHPSSLSTGPVFGVIVGLPAGGIIGILALLFPAVFGGVAILMRRWAALVAVLFTTSTLFSCYVLWPEQFWWTRSQTVWAGILLVTLAGAAWAWIRQLHYLDPECTEPAMPARTERIMLFVLSNIALAGLLTILALNNPELNDLKLFLWITGVGFWVGTLYAFLPKSAHFERRALPTEGLVLVCMALTAVVLTARGSSATVEGGRDLKSAATGDAKKGAELVRQVWKFTPQGQSDMASTPVVVGKRVYLGVIHFTAFEKIGRVYCLESYLDEQGVEKVREVWRFDHNGKMKQMFSSPCIHGDKLYIGEGFHENNECNLFCLDVATGKLNWAFNTASEEEDKLWSFPTNSHVESTPFVANGRVFFGAGDKGLYCVDVKNGKKVWQYPEPGNRQTGLHIDTSPVVVGNRVFCCSGKSQTFKQMEVFCVEAASGKKVWSRMADLPVWGSPSIHDGLVYVGLGNTRINEESKDATGSILCLDAFDGSRRWDYPVKGAVHTKQAFAGGLVYAGSQDGHCYALDAREGTLVWKRDLGSITVSSPALVRGAWDDAPSALYIAALKGDVYCLDPRTGDVFWHFDELSSGGEDKKGFGAAMLTSPAVTVQRTPDGDQRRIYIASGVFGGTSSVLYCLEDKWIGDAPEK